MTLPELSAKISGAIAGKVKPLLDGKQDKLAVTGAANKGIYVSATGVVSPMTYELNANVPANFAPGTAVPLMDGTAAVGTSAKYAHEDHRHDTDTSRASAADLTVLRDLISRMEIYCEASGNPATFQDADAANLKELSVTITPTQSGSGDPSPTNIRPITGVSSVAVTRTGRNLLPILASSSADGYSHVLNADGSVTFSGTPSDQQATVHTVSSGMSFRAGTYKIAVSYDNGASNIAIDAYLPANAASGRQRSTYLSLNAAPPNGRTAEFTAMDRDILSVYSYPLDRSLPVSGTARIMLVRASDDTVFEPYQGQSVTVTLTDGSNPLAVYGGTLDVTVGELSVTWANIASYNGETLPGRWISDRDVYAPGTTPTTGAQVVYELAAPATYQLTPQQLAALAGYNAVASDAGAVDVTYKADTSLVFGGG